MKKKIQITPKRNPGFEVMELEDERLADVLGGGCGDNCGNNCCNSSRTCISEF